MDTSALGMKVLLNDGNVVLLQFDHGRIARLVLPENAILYRRPYRTDLYALIDVEAYESVSERYNIWNTDPERDMLFA